MFGGFGSNGEASVPCDLLMPMHRRWSSLSFIGSPRPLSKCSIHISVKCTVIVLYDTWTAMYQCRVNGEAGKAAVA